MKKIAPEQFINQIRHGLEIDIINANYITEQDKKANGYKETLEDMQKVLEALNQPPYKVMLYSIIQSAVDTLQAG